MRVLLISANTERINMTVLPVGLAMVAEATRQAGHRVVYLDLLKEREARAAIEEAVVRCRPEVIGVSVRNVDDQQMQAPTFLLEGAREVVRACRQLSRAPVVVGGAGFSIFAGAALEALEADLGVCGAGEEVFPAVLDCLAGGKDPLQLPGVHVRGGVGARPPVHRGKLDAAPVPGEELWQGVDLADPELWIPVACRRGCPLDCVYCSTALIEGRRIRTRSPESVVEQMARMADTGVRQVQMVDSVFNLPPSYALELSRRLATLSSRIRWRAIVYPHRVSTELVQAMARAGCVEVSLGFESGSDPMLRRLNKRFTREEVRSISERLAAAGIRRFGFLLFGGPGETPDSVEESLDFAESLGLEMVKVTVGIRIYPHTPLARAAVAEGVIGPGDDLLHPRFYLARGLERCMADLVQRRTRPPGFLRRPGEPG